MYIIFFLLSLENDRPCNLPSPKILNFLLQECLLQSFYNAVIAYQEGIYNTSKARKNKILNSKSTSQRRKKKG